ncbi:Chromosome partition protein Smc [Clostridioides difficile]|nr:Chromosome partition protein Smc [Clostridioides difficile]CZT58718.1 Chromosome partition protein Smc [Clostridioides difficile]HCU2836566.1 phage tail tape measure protein [Clostridioides difficile]
MSLELGTAVGYLDLDGGKFFKALADAAKQLSQFNSSTKTTGSAMTAMGKQISDTANSLTQIGRQSALAASELNKIASTSSGPFSSLKNSIKETENELRTARSTIDTYGQGISRLTSEIDKSKQKYTEIGSKIERYEQQLERCNSMYGESSEQSQRYREAIERLKNSQTQLGNEIENGEESLTDMRTAMNNAEAEANRLSDSLRSMPFDAIGTKMKDIGQTLTSTVTTGLVAMGTAAVTAATNTEQAMSVVNSILQLNTEKVQGGKSEWDAYASTLKEGANEIGMAYDEYANSAYNAISASVKQADVTEFLAQADKLATAGLTDLAKATDVLTTIQNAYGMSQKDMAHVSDVLIQTQNKGKLTVDELASSMGKIIPTAKNVNVSVEQLGAGYAILTARGIGAAEATTYMGEMYNELGKSGTKVDKILKKLTNKGFADLQKEGKTTADVLLLLNNYAKKNSLSLADLFGSANGAKAANVMLGDAVDSTTGRIIEGTKSADSFNQMLNDMKNSTGLCDKAFEQLDNTTKTKLEDALNSTKNMLSDLGEVMMPVIAKVAEMATAFMKSVSEMAKSNPNFARIVVSIGAVVAAIGPLLVVLGTMAITIPKAVGAIKNLGGTFTFLSRTLAVVRGATIPTSAGMATLAKAISFLSTPVGTLTLALGALAVVIGTNLVKEMSKPAIEIDNFGKDVDKSTKKIVGSYLEMSEEITKSAMKMQLSGSVITKDMVNEMAKNLDGLEQQVLPKFEEFKSKALETLSGLWNQSNELNSKREIEITGIVIKSLDEQKEKFKENSKRINEIWSNASKEKRELTIKEGKEISKLQQENNDMAITVLSKSASDALIIKERVHANNKKMTVKQAAELRAEENKNYKAQKDDIEKAYNEQLLMAAIAREAGTEEANKGADELVAAAKKQREDSLKELEGQHKETVTEIEKMVGDGIKAYNGDGTVKSKWTLFQEGTKEDINNAQKNLDQWCKDIDSKFSIWWNDLVEELSTFLPKFIEDWNRDMEVISNNLSTWWESIKTGFLDWWNGICEDWSNGWQKLKDDASEWWENIKQGISDWWDSICEGWTTGWQNLGDNFNSWWQDLKDKWLSSMEELGIDTSSVWGFITSSIEESWNFIKDKAEEIWNNIKNYIEDKWDELRDKSPIFKTISDIISKAWDFISGKKTIWNSITSFVAGKWNELKSKSPIFDTISSLISKAWDVIKGKTSIWDVIKGLIQTAWVNIKTDIDRKITLIKSAIQTGFNKMKDFMTKPFSDAKSTIDRILGGISSAASKVKSVVSGFFKSGPMIHQGSNNFIQQDMLPTSRMFRASMEGLTSSRGSILDSISKLSNTMAKGMGSSSSGIVSQFGRAGENSAKAYLDGLSNIEEGLTNTLRTVQAIIGNGNIKEAQEIKKFNKEVKKLQEEKAEEIAELDKEHKKKQKERNEKENEEIKEAEAKKYKNKKEKLAALKKIKDKYNKKSVKDQEEYREKLEKINKKYDKKEKEDTEKHQEELQKLREEKIKAERDFNKKYNDIKEDYAEKVANLDKKYIEDQKKLNEEYQKIYDSRVKSLMDYTDLFSSVTFEEIDNDELMENLEEQVDVLRKWDTDMADLSTKVGKDLYEELLAKGPQAHNEIEAINKMSKEQLEEYERLYQEKKKIAERRAKEDTEDEKYRIEKEIEELKKTYDAEYRKLGQEMQRSIEEQIESFKDKFGVVPAMFMETGKDSMQGMIDGIKSMQGALGKVLSDIVNSINKQLSNIGFKDVNIPTGGRKEAARFRNEIENLQSIAYSDTLARGIASNNLLKDATVNINNNSKVDSEKSSDKKVELTLHIEKFINNTKQDIEQLGSEIAFITNRKLKF